MLEPFAFAGFRNDAAGQIPLDVPAPDSVFRNPFYQRELTVLDSALDRQEPFADLGRSPGSLDYLPPFLSEHSSDRVRLRPCLKQMAQLADPNRHTRTSAAVDCDPTLVVAL